MAHLKKTLKETHKKHELKNRSLKAKLMGNKR